MRLPVFAVIAACGPGLPHAAEPEYDARDDSREVLRDARGNARIYETLLRGSVANGGLWFSSAACLGFSVPGEIATAQLPAFAKCLAELGLEPSRRNNALGDVVVMTYKPGFEVDVRVVNEPDGLRITYIGYVSKSDAR